LNEQNKYPSSTQGQLKVESLRESEYVYTFIAPLWSPDLAGWTTLLAFIIIIIIIVKMMITTILKLILKKYKPKV